MLTATHIETDQNWKDETTTYWFKIDGVADDHGMTIAADGEYGWADNNGHVSILDADGCPLTDGDGITEAVRSALEKPVSELMQNA